MCASGVCLCIKLNIQWWSKQKKIIRRKEKEETKCEMRSLWVSCAHVCVGWRGEGKKGGMCAPETVKYPSRSIRFAIEVEFFARCFYEYFLWLHAKAQNISIYLTIFLILFSNFILPPYMPLWRWNNPRRNWNKWKGNNRYRNTAAAESIARACVRQI